MKNNLLSLLSFFMLLSFPIGNLHAQDGSSRPNQEEKKGLGIQFNGLGRAILNNTNLEGEITETDTVSPKKLSDGEFLLDVALNAQPNEDTEVQGILRIRNEFGGFFGAGVTTEVRELWARGVIAKAIKYRVGDFDHVMTPYTFFLADEEGMVNEPTVFQPQKDVINYEQFYTDDNTRRLQGANLDFGLEFPVLIDEADLSGFIARLRPTDFLNTPSRFVGGGRLGLSTLTLNDSLGLRAKAGFNLSHTWDDLNSGDATSGIRNMVWSVDFDITVMDKENLGIHVIGEAGRSSLEFKEDSISVFDEGDSFLEAGVSVELKPSKLTFTAKYIDIGPDFFSTGAQSKRVDFSRNRTFFNRIGNDRLLRTPSLFDLSRDRAMYTFQLSDRLMAYDPRYANVMPYGDATPNRAGLKLGVDYGDSNSPIEASLNVALLEEIRGQGTFELKSFRQVRAMANVNLHNMLELEKNLRVTLGLQNEQTDRSGQEVENIDFSSNLLEIGIEAELFSRCDLLLGGKFLAAEGREYIPLIQEYNDVLDFPAPYDIDETESLIGAGLRYRFKDNVYLTVQYHQFSLSRENDAANDYEINQFFVNYNMEF